MTADPAPLPPGAPTGDLRISLVEVLERVAPGSFPTWDEEEEAIRSRICLCCSQPGHYQDQLEAWAAEHGIDQAICVDGGRVIDGNHRVIAARRLGIDWLPLESESQAGERWVRDHGLVGWLGRTRGDMAEGEAAWITADALCRWTP